MRLKRLLKKLKPTSIQFSVGPPFIQFTYRKSKKRPIATKAGPATRKFEIIPYSQLPTRLREASREMNPVQQTLIPRIGEQKNLARLQGNYFGEAAWSFVDFYLRDPKGFKKFMQDLDNALNF